MKCFVYAARGFAYAVRTQRNMRIHLGAAFYVVLAGFVTDLSVSEWAAVLLCIGLVLALELVNTAIEYTCDSITKEYAEPIKHAKDCAAGAVLCAAVAAAAVGCIIFFGNGRPYAAWEFFTEHPLCAAALVLSLPVWIRMIWGRRK